VSEIPASDWTWINAAADRFERAWKQGTPPRIEDYLAEVEESQRPGLLGELLRVDLELRRRAGEKPTVQEYLERFPDHAAMIDAVLLEAVRPNITGDGEPLPGSMTGGPDRSQLGNLLDMLAQVTGSAPHVLLRDTDAVHEEPVVRPSSPELPRDSGRYQIVGEIGRGGVGSVMKGRDPDLGRDLAVKILLDEHQDAPELVRRFVEEAQIGGQLQHPGIVPVYELGQFGDHRPYFTMKLVRGRTLAALLKERAGPVHDLPRFLGIFEQICQTVAYAHSRGVIHRDLKPLNIMVGSFGEVQVMDWGLAKVLPQPGTTDDPPPHPDVPPVSVVLTVRSGSDADASRPGSVLGTPAYMAPEQAGGDVDAIDERADVFGLGSILCEILTGRPAYTGSSSGAILRKAQRGETADALRRLDDCGSDSELVALAGHCLSAAPEERPRDAGEVARRMTAYLSGVQERLRAAELARAAEEARAEEALATAMAAMGRARAERQARWMTVGLAASVLIAGVLGAAGWRWVERDRAVRIAARSAQVNTALQEATGLWGKAQSAAVGDLVAWTRALAAAQKARDLLEPDLDVALRSQAESMLAAITSEKAGAEAAARAAGSDRLLLDKLVDIRSAKTDDPYGSISDLDYAGVFQEAGIDLMALPPAEVGARIKARTTSVAAGLVAALDDWAAARRSRRYDRPGAMRLSEAAIAADPDPWRVGLRRALDLDDRASRAKALRDVAASTKPETAPAVDLDLLGTALAEVGEPKVAEEVLRDGRRRFPADVWLNYDLAHFLEVPSRWEEAVRYYSIARALRPETAHDLAHVLERKGESVEAIAVFRDLVRLRPDDGRHWGCYGVLLKERGDRAGSKEALEKAVAILRKALQKKPVDAIVHYNLGRYLDAQEKRDEAIAEYRETIRLRPDYLDAHNNLGNVLRDQGKREEGVAEYREAIRLKPDHAGSHLNLGNALDEQGRPEEAIAKYREAIRLEPHDPMSHHNLGRTLATQGKLDQAVAEFHTAIQLKPDYSNARISLAGALYRKGKQVEAVAEYREVIRLDPGHARAHELLGITLREQGKLDDAIAEYREAIRLKPDEPALHSGLGAMLCDLKHDYAQAEAEFLKAIQLLPGEATFHSNLGNALQHQGKAVQAIAAYRAALRLNPNYAPAHKNLGTALSNQGKLDEAIAEYREAIRLDRDPAKKDATEKPH